MNGDDSGPGLEDVIEAALAVTVEANADKSDGSASDAAMLRDAPVRHAELLKLPQLDAQAISAVNHALQLSRRAGWFKVLRTEAIDEIVAWYRTGRSDVPEAHVAWSRLWESTGDHFDRRTVVTRVEPQLIGKLSSSAQETEEELEDLWLAAWQRWVTPRFARANDHRG